MTWFKNQTLMTKCMISSALIGVIMTVVGAIGMINLKMINANTENLYEVQLSAVRQALTIQNNVSMVRFWVLRAVTAPDKAYQEASLEKIAALVKQNNDNRVQFEKTIASDAVRKAFGDFDAALVAYRESRAKTIELALEGKQAQAMARIDNETRLAYEAVLKSITHLVELTQSEARRQYESAQSLYATAKVMLILVNLVGLVLGILFSWLLARFITRNMAVVLQAAQRLGGGDLSVRAVATTQDEVGQLAHAFNDMGDKLQTAAAAQQAQNAEIAAKTFEVKGITDAISRSQAVIEFNLDGTVIIANDNFLQCLGYRLDEIKGRHHRMFCDPSYANSAEYQVFWATLNRGEFEAGVYPRKHKNGREIWIQASYNPILNAEGTVYKVVKYATDVTAQKLLAIESEGILKAIDRGQAMVGFNMDGTVRSANDIFLNIVGYRLDEIKGQHYRIFCPPDSASGGDCVAFWEKLNRGEFAANVYQWVGKGGKACWLQATFNPISDVSGKPYKVVTFATDITAQKLASADMERLVAEAETILGQVAASDLTQEMTGVYSGELEKVKASVNGVVQNLIQTITTVREVVESIASSSEQITQGNSDLSQRTNEQASSLEETAASMQEITETVKQNADNAKQANQLAIEARATANKGGDITQQAVAAMEEINKSSKKIADIITVIDEIAFQTNLLALNAAVEAARAGEHGRGFAVVAAEVRNLAQRSALAAKEIKGLIHESIQRVTDGSELVNQSGKTLGEIVGSVKRVTDIIAEISAASQEQASGVNQVNKAIMVVDQTTQQNAALVEEITSTSHSMKAQSEELLRRMAMFTLTLSEPEKAAIPSIAAAREHAARSISRAFTKGPQEHMKRPRSSSPSVPQASASKTTTVRVGAGSHPASREDFEEF
ncbi:MAG: PAS domain-containing protein [Nitrospira sp.]|nr:PAS domain-containing protein [Nitrospira sp.]